MVRNIVDVVGKIYAKIPPQYQDTIRPYFSEEAVYLGIKKLGVDSDIGLATSLIFLCIALIFGWMSQIRLNVFFWGSLTFLGLTNIIVLIGYKAWIGHYLALPQFWVNIPLMLLPISGILYQLRDYFKIIGRGKIRHHITYSNLSPFE